MKTEIIRVDPINPDRGALMAVAEIVKKGGTVAFPTETVYGLGADTFSESATAKIFEAKGRPRDNPLIVHIRDLNQLELVARPEGWVYEIAERLWPGPITLILPRGMGLSDTVTAGLKTVAVRMPAHPVALAIIELSGVPIAAPSANLAGKPSPTNAKHVIDDLYGKVDAIVDAGETFFGVESTIVNITTRPPVLLRPGPLSVEELEPVMGKITVTEEARGYAESERPQAPGMKYRHYAPKKRVILAGSRGIYLKLLKESAKHGKVAAICSEEMKPKVDELGIICITIGSESNLYTVASGLFSSLRMLDETDADFGVAQPFPEKGIGLAIMNRLRKASGHIIINSLEEIVTALKRVG